MEAASCNVRALEVTLSELERLGRLELIDTAKVQIVRSLASALDADPSSASLWRQYREALGELTADDDDGFDPSDLFSKMGNAAKT